MAIADRAASPASTADEYTKPVVSTQLIEAFHTYAWAATGELVSDGITPFNITYAIEPSTQAVALKVSHLVTVESRGAGMSFANAWEFLQGRATFPLTTAACGHRLAAHNVLVDLMLGEMAPFAMAYHQCIQQLRPHFDLSLMVHYGEVSGKAYQIALRILFWLTQQFLYYLSERKFRRAPPIPDFPGLLHHLHTKTLDGFIGRLPTSWLEQVSPRATPQSTSGVAPTQASRGGRGSMNPATNTNYVTSIKRCWLASGHATIAQLLQAYTGEGEPPVPMVGDQAACLSWILKGRCYKSCP